MKKIILIFAIIVSFTNCKKSTTAAPTPTEVKCVFVMNGGFNGTSRYFYKCSSSATEMTQIAMELRNQNLFYETITKSTCSECQ